MASKLLVVILVRSFYNMKLLMSAVTGYYAVVLINVQYCLFGSNRKSITPFCAARTDSPHLKVKPMSKRAGSGCVQLGVECYGGG